MSMLFGSAHQLGYVVRDIEAAMNHWTRAMGIGPFYYLPQVPFPEFTYQGKPSPVAVGGAIAYSGNIQIELIQPLDQAPSSYRAFLDAGHEGLHHIGYLSEQYDELLQKALDSGLEIEQAGAVLDPTGRFTYFISNGHPGTMVELIAVNDTNRNLFGMIREECRRWGGENPIRPLL